MLWMLPQICETDPKSQKYRACNSYKEVTVSGATTDLPYSNTFQNLLYNTEVVSSAAAELLVVSV